MATVKDRIIPQAKNDRNKINSAFSPFANLRKPGDNTAPENTITAPIYPKTWLQGMPRAKIIEPKIIIFSPKLNGE